MKFIHLLFLFCPIFLLSQSHFEKGEKLYGQKKYNEALNEITKTKHLDYIYYLNAKTLQLKILCELNEFENILTVIDSFKHYLNSNKYIPEQLKIKSLNVTFTLVSFSDIPLLGGMFLDS